MLFFDRLNSLIRNGEASFVNVLSALAPWLAPLAPAYMTFIHLSDSSFGFPFLVAFSVAAVVEVLGLSAISTMLSFWTHNRRRLAEHKKAPVQAAVFSFSMYLLVVITINVVLDGARLLSGNYQPYDVAVIIAKLLLTLLSIPAAVILGSRAIHTETLNVMESEKEEKASRKRNRVEKVESANNNTEGRKHFIKSIVDNKDSVNLSNTNSVVSYIVENYNVSERTAFRWLSAAKEQLEEENKA